MQKQATYKVLDYDPFGMQMPSRSFTGASGYKFGFNGQEKENDISGVDGGHLAFTYRIHDARLGRFLSADPMGEKFPWNSYYAFAENRVIDGIDLEGLEYVNITQYGLDYFLGGGQGPMTPTQNQLVNHVNEMCGDINNLNTVTIDGNTYIDVGAHVYHNQDGFNTSGSRAEQVTENSMVGVQLIANIDNLSAKPSNVTSPPWTTTNPEEIALSQEQANKYSNADGVCYAVTESRANQAYIDMLGEGVVNLTVSGKNQDHRVAASVGTNDPNMGYGAGGPFANNGYGTTVDNTGVWAGELQTGALIQRWNSTSNNLSDLMGSGGHSYVFRNYLFDGNGNITGFEYTDNHGGVSQVDRASSEASETIYGVNLKD